MCRFLSLYKHFSPVQIDVFFFHFLSGGVQQTAKNFMFCWFWLGKMHQNGLSGAYLGFEVCQIQWYRLWVSTISGSWKITIWGKNSHILLILTGINASKWLEWHVFRVWGMPNPMAQVSSLYDKWFLKNHNLRQKFHIFVDFDWNKCIKMAWVACIYGLRHAKSNGTGFKSLW